MPIIEIKSYKDIQEYKKRNDKGCNTSNPIIITKKDMISYAISIGGFSDLPVSKKGRNFYRELIDMALDIENKYFVISKDYKNSETSIKGSISFFMGMIAAKAVADKAFNVPYLFHLNDKSITFESNGGHPDFVGLINGDKDTPILVEAKGTASEKKPELGVIKKAKKQLGKVYTLTIRYNGVQNTYKANGLSKYIEGHVVASSFENQRLTYYDIDPVPGGNTILSVDFDKAIIVYYRTIMNMLLTNECISYTLMGEDYIITEFGEYNIGLNKNIFYILLKYRDIYMLCDNKNQEEFRLEKLNYLYNTDYIRDTYRIICEYASTATKKVNSVILKYFEIKIAGYKKLSYNLINNLFSETEESYSYYEKYKMFENDRAMIQVFNEVREEIQNKVSIGKDGIIIFERKDAEYLRRHQ